jgi:hypothetical protein
MSGTVRSASAMPVVQSERPLVRASFLPVAAQTAKTHVELRLMR